MKQFAQILAVACVAALALAVSAAGASASTFTASATGELAGDQTTNQVFTTGGGGNVTCLKAHTTGEITSTATETQEVTVVYSECTAFGFKATVSNATYDLHASGTADLTNEVVITISGSCTTRVAAQNGLSSNTYTNAAGGELEQKSTISGIKSTASGFPCTGGTNGTYSGTSKVHRVGGGTLSWDA